MNLSNAFLVAAMYSTELRWPIAAGGAYLIGATKHKLIGGALLAFVGWGYYLQQQAQAKRDALAAANTSVTFH